MKQKKNCKGNPKLTKKGLPKLAKPSLKTNSSNSELTIFNSKNILKRNSKVKFIRSRGSCSSHSENHKNKQKWLGKQCKKTLRLESANNGKCNSSNPWSNIIKSTRGILIPSLIDGSSERASDVGNISMMLSRIVPLNITSQIEPAKQRLEFLKRVFTMLTELVAISLIIAVLTCYYNDYTRWWTLLMSVLLCIIIIPIAIFAWWTKFDYTTLFYWPFIIGMLVILIIFATLYITITTKLTVVMFQTVTSTAFYILLQITIQMIFADNRQKKFMPTQFVRSTIALYFEIVAIFLYMPGIHLFTIYTTN